MIFLRSANHLPIGVDLGFDSIKLLQLQQRGGGLAVRAVAQHFVPDAEKSTGEKRVAYAIGQLRELMRDSDFRGRQVVAVLPREYVQVKTIRLPVLPDVEMQSAIQLEARNLFTADPETLVTRFIPAGEVRQGTESRMEVIVLAVETRLINSLLDQYHAAGLVVDSLDFETCSVYRGIERFVRRKEDENEVNVLVDIGSRQSQVIIGRGRDITFTKSIDIGGRMLSECVSRKLSLSLDEACSLRRRIASLDPEDKDPVRQAVMDATRNALSDLAREVSLCLRYYSVTFRGQRPAKVRLLGGEARDPNLQQTMAASLTVPIELYHPCYGIESSAAAAIAPDEAMSEWSVAFGAALRRVKPNAVRRTDLATRSFGGRRRDDASVVEVVDLSAAIKTAGVHDAHEPRPAKRAEEAAHA
jgi:type IV pilus assembly protein PilM